MFCNRTKLAIKHRIKKNKTNKQASKQTNKNKQKPNKKTKNNNNEQIQQIDLNK
jgi:hypothetical protein